MRNALLFFVSALLLFVGGSAWIVLYPNVPADLGGVENMDRQAHHISIPVGQGDRLDGWYLKGVQPATVILFPGYARDHRREWRYAQFLHREGFGVLAVDFRSTRSHDRKPTTLGYWELRDARAVLDWVHKLPQMRGQRVALFGESLGGSTALALAAERPDVNAVVADCPFASGDAAIADGLRYVLHLPPSPLEAIARALGKLVTGHDPGELDATQALRALNGRPVLLIQTRMEDRYSRDQVERLTTAAGLEAETWTVDDSRHTEVWVAHREEYERRVARFLGLRLGVPIASAAKSPARPAKGASVGVKAGGRTAAKPPKKPPGGP